MSKLRRLQHEIKALTREGLIATEGGHMIIRRDEDRERVISRILQTGPWGALMLIGKLDEALEEIHERDARREKEDGTNT